MKKLQSHDNNLDRKIIEALMKTQLKNEIDNSLR